MRHAHFIQTFTGITYYPADPRPLEVDIRDIAHALSLLCRYTGHCRVFYSVAEHSLHVADLVRSYGPDIELEALLHDAAEAYCNDISRPLKRSLRDYRIVESLNDIAVRARFDLPVQHTAIIKEADNDLLHCEYAALMKNPLPEGTPGVFRELVNIRGYMPDEVETMFLHRFTNLYKGVF
jgi:uncharacterized protein